jgi:2-polyprenyl-3-methyl-5-hydroxy-6-metoxy-1,4-benzoquinol methylase
MKKKVKFDYERVLSADVHDRAPGFHKRIYDKKPELRRIVEMVKIKEGRILDIGCATGLITESLPYYFPKAKIYGCDISVAAIAYNKKFGSKKISYKTMNKKLPYPSNYFDVCLCIDVLEHVPDVDFLLKEVKRVLKKDGVFMGAIPCEGQPLTISWFLKKIGFLDYLTLKHVGHIHPEFTHKYVIKLFERHGFSLVKRTFSERLPVQFLRYFLFLIPKEVLEKMIGKKKAEKYAVYREDKKAFKQERKDIFIFLRSILFQLGKLTGFIDRIDAEYLKNLSITAWKLNLVVRNNK